MWCHIQLAPLHHGAVKDVSEVQAPTKAHLEGDLECQANRLRIDEEELRMPRRRISVEVRLLVLIQRQGQAVGGRP